MSTELPTAIRFAGLFAGRNDAFFDGYRAVWKRPTINTFRRHLSGEIDGIGTYPVRDNKDCKWSCIDLDGEDYTFERAVEVWSVWQYYGITAFIERSRSKGWHIWTFLKEWTSAETVRNAGLQVAKLAQLPEKTEVNPKGIDPKQTRTGLINTVRLPYPGRGNWQRQVVLDPPSALVLDLETFIDQAERARAPVAAMEHPAGIYRAAILSEARTERYSTLLRNSPNLERSRINQEAMEVLKGNRKVNVNRDNQLYTIAMLMHGIGVPREEALRRMEEIWHNQLDQTKDFYPLGQALKKVERAYA